MPYEGVEILGLSVGGPDLERAYCMVGINIKVYLPRLPTHLEGMPPALDSGLFQHELARPQKMRLPTARSSF